MSQRNLNTTHKTNKDLLDKSKAMMDRLKTTKKAYNPAPKESKDGKVQK